MSGKHTVENGFMVQVGISLSLSCLRYYLIGDSVIKEISKAKKAGYIYAVGKRDSDQSSNETRFLICQ